MRRICLTQGKHAIVDDVDYESLSGDSWFYDGAYAARKSPKKIYMHRIINKTPKGFETDHINRNKLDNRRSNLRTVTSSENSLNITVRKDNQSGATGVCYDKSRGKWMAYINKKHCRTYLGRFDSKQEAILARESVL